MEIFPWLPVAALLAGGVAGGFLWLLIRTAPTPVSRPDECDAPKLTSTFLLNGETIIDTDHGKASGCFTSTPTYETWRDLREWLGQRFPGLPEKLPSATSSEEAVFHPAAAGDGGVLSLSACEGRHLVTLHEPKPPSPARWHDALIAASEKASLEHAVESAPIAMCLVNAEGTMTWQNPAFAALGGEEREAVLAAAQHAQDAQSRPVRIGSRTFEVTVSAAHGLLAVHAADTTRVMQADAVRNTFIQTLTKTFADLDTGLAVFDRSGQLVLFNPAMVDLTGLSAAFLSGRPGLLDFFDQLRNRNVLPEPRNYPSWRGQINDMIETASATVYCETWSLPSGLTYRVTGRPHPDGAVAFLIEDISDEVSMTRRSRNQLGMHQALLDRIEEAIAVFGADGVLAFCNRNFQDLLDFDPDSRLTDTTFEQIVGTVRTKFPSIAHWAESAMAGTDLPKERREVVIPHASARCRLEALPGGAVMLSLSRLSAKELA
ncbi:PAS-domain containing protein [Roseovarius salis]|uniref:PAS-domain containing protein n=1 Tax=Roseovarius salis TaxID=3376063 RepID=UPI0037CA758F